jgi:signal transduction histidine kinase
MSTQPSASSQYPQFDEGPSLWPNRSAEVAMPQEIEETLEQALLATASDVERALRLMDDAVRQARSWPGEPRILARTLFRAAYIARQANRPDRTFVLSLEAQPALERLDERWRASKMLLLRGVCYLLVNEHERALELINDAAERFSNLNDNAELGRCYSSLAAAYGAGGDMQKAVDSAARALALFDSQGSRGSLRRQLQNNEAHCWLQLGKQHAAAGQTQQAQQEFERAQAALPELQPKAHDAADFLTATYLGTAIDVHIAAGNLAAARERAKDLARWARQGHSALEKGRAWLHLAELRVMQQQPRSAIACARRAVAHLAQLPQEPDLVTAQLLLAQLLEEVGDLKEAYDSHVRANQFEEQQQREQIAMRAQLLTLDVQAEEEQRKTTQTLEYAQRLSNVGHMVASINHELNQPMSSIKMLAETTIELLQRGHHEEAQANVALMQKLSTRLMDLTAKLAAFPAQPGPSTANVNLSQAVNEALNILRSRLAQTPCEVLQQLPQVGVRAVEGQLVRVLANLLNNALDAMQNQAQRRIEISASVEGGEVALRVADNGPGLQESVRERLFQPFFSTKAAGHGLGLGLALSRDAVRQMQGELSARNRSRGGAEFRITLPVAQQP